MKTIKYTFVFLVSLLTVFAFNSCDNNDGYNPGDFKLELATVHPLDTISGDYYLTLDDGTTLWPAVRNAYYKPKTNQRVIVDFTLLSDQVGEYDHYARINGIQDILTKKVVNLTSENAEEIGNDPIKILSMWTGDNYLNIFFGYNTGGEKVHVINLVNNKPDNVSADGTITLEFRHNANKDPERYGVKNYAAFDLRSFRTENNDSIKFIIKVLDFGNETKEYPITYKY